MTSGSTLRSLPESGECCAWESGSTAPSVSRGPPRRQRRRGRGLSRILGSATVCRSLHAPAASSILTQVYAMRLGPIPDGARPEHGCNALGSP
eukprot:6968755-Pyramimonas_sp.AAC.2